MTGGEGASATPALPRSILRLPGQGVSETPPGLTRLAWLDALRLLVPAVAAGVAVTLGDGDAGDGLLSALAIYFASALVLNVDFPLHLLRAARVLLTVIGALLGSGAIALAAALGSGVKPSFAQDFLLPIGAGSIAGILFNFFYLAYMRRRPVRIAGLGSPDFAAGLTRELEENDIGYIHMVGFVVINTGRAADDHDYLVRVLAEQTAEQGIDVFVFGPAPGSGGALRSRMFQRVAEACLDIRVRLISGNQFYEDVFGHVPLGTITGAWYLSLVHPNFKPPPGLVRRFFDLAVSVPVAVLAAPLIALSALAIKLDDGGPVFYRQTRVGERGREFEILKLRTMSIDAEREGAQFSTAGDRRVTRVGRILRRTHVDELPQIVNVVRGEMRLVGPRPERPEIVAEMERTFPQYSGRHHLKPGVTGWAQVRCGYAGSTLGTAWKLCHDLYYLKHRSMLSDMMIIFETLAIAAKDAHRPLRVPESQFVFGRELGLDTSVDEAGGVPDPDQADVPVRVADGG